jgi:hypothetical protein
MSTRPWWSHAIQWGLWALVMTATMRWLARSRAAMASATTAGALVQPRSILVIGVVCTGVFLAIAVLSAMFPGSTGSPAISLGFLGFALLGGCVLLDYRNGRHVLTPTGMEYGRLMGGRGTFEWHAVHRLTYSHTMKWFRIELADTRVVRISAMLSGLPAFAGAALAAVSPAAIDPAARPLLEQTAAGDPPSIWA